MLLVDPSIDIVSPGGGAASDPDLKPTEQTIRVGLRTLDPPMHQPRIVVKEQVTRPPRVHVDILRPDHLALDLLEKS